MAVADAVHRRQMCRRLAAIGTALDRRIVEVDETVLAIHARSRRGMPGSSTFGQALRYRSANT